jgi:acyl-coenzyme A synthetase/AMP-(fatty) acid ligase
MALIEDIPGAVGFLHPGVQAQVVDEADRPLPSGAEGLLRVRTPGQALGYRNDPVATARHFRDGWFYPGDVGRITAEGLLIVTGRASDVINLGGRKVAPDIIERVLEDLPEVREAAAFGVPGQNEIVELWAAVVADGPLDARALAGHLSARLGPNAPAYLLQVSALPRNANGKLLRQELAALATRPAG